MRKWEQTSNICTHFSKIYVWALTSTGKGAVSVPELQLIAALHSRCIFLGQKLVPRKKRKKKKLKECVQNHANSHHVLFIALLEDIDTEINRGSSSFNFSRKAAKQRRRSSSQSLKLFFPCECTALSNKWFVLKFCDDFLAFFLQEWSKSSFPFSWLFSNKR